MKTSSKVLIAFGVTTLIIMIALAIILAPSIA